MRLKSNEKFLKSLYKTLTVFLSICWCIMALIGFNAWFTRKKVFPLSHKEIVFEYADFYGLDRALVFAVIKTESSFDLNAISKAGAVGLMQITPTTAKYIAQKLGAKQYDLTDPRTNVNFGCYYINYLILRFNDTDTALIAYNAGEGNVALWLENPDYSTDGKRLTTIPFIETREYIKKIHENFSKYKKLYRNILDKT